MSKKSSTHSGLTKDFIKGLLPWHNSNVVGMSIEKLFDMWWNDEMTNFHATYSNVFFEVQNWDRQDSAETAAHIT